MMEENNKTTEELIAEAYRLYKEENDGEDYWQVIRKIEKRGTLCEFEAAQTLSHSTDPINREIAANILSQLGWSTKSFHDESVAILIQLLSDEVDDVIASAAFALGNRKDARGIPYLIPLAEHKNHEVRWGVACGLSCFDDESAINTLIKLSKDSNYDVRNWATFGLGSLCEIDTKELRQALFERLLEEDAEIRGEALIGLAKRKDETVKDAIKKELSGEFYGNWVLEAAELMADPEFCPLLQNLKQRMLDDDEEERFIRDADTAIMACCNK